MNDITLGRHLNFSELLSAELVVEILIVSDKTVASYYLDELNRSLTVPGRKIKSYVLPGGESSKSIDHYTDAIGFLLSHGFSRRTTVISLGGGVVGDFAGFLASTFMRGVALIHIPTSLLAQVDASLGGKTGLNHPLGKNMIGTFYPPERVYVDVCFLRTLPPQEFLCGLAEVIKHGMLGSLSLLEFMERKVEKLLAREETALLEMVALSRQVKERMVDQDPHEKNIRAYLNLGHTLGHAIETVSGYQIPHGLAVSVGLHFALKISVKLAGMSEGDFHRCRHLMGKLGLPIHPSELGSSLHPSNLKEGSLLSSWMKAIQRDKKNASGKITFVVLKGIETPGLLSLESLILEHELAEFLRSV